MGPVIDITGMRYGKLTVVSRLETEDSDTWWLCKCDCGNDFKRRSHHLRGRGSNQSCGCQRYSRPVKYALLVDGEHLPLDQVSKRFDIPDHVVRRAAEKRMLTVEWITAWKHRKWQLDQAALLGLSKHARHKRRKAWGESDRVYTTPKGATRLRAAE